MKYSVFYEYVPRYFFVAFDLMEIGNNMKIYLLQVTVRMTDSYRFVFYYGISSFPGIMF